MRAVRLLLVLVLLAVGVPAHAAEVSYGSDPEQVIDVTPLAGSGHPWVMVVHGGSWAAGSTVNGVRAQQVFTAAGFVVFNIDYRKITDYPDNPGVPWGKQRDGILDALDWVHAHAAEYGADPDRGAIYGFSAGGHLAASAGLYGNGLTRVKAIVSVSGVLQPDRVVTVANTDQGTVGNRTLAGWEAVAMRCPMVTWTDCAARWNDYRPSNHIGANDPPILITQGTADPVVPPATAPSFKYWMNHAGLEAQLIECAGWGHTETCALDGGWRQAKLIAWLKAKTT